MKQNRRILIIGGPRCGKTTLGKDLSRKLGIPCEHFDRYISKLGWSETSDAIADDLNSPGPWIKEGVAGVRGLRKWLRRNKKVPDFEIIVLNKPHIQLSQGQKRMHENHGKILDEVMQEIEHRKKMRA